MNPVECAKHALYACIIIQVSQVLIYFFFFFSIDLINMFSYQEVNSILLHQLSYLIFYKLSKFTMIQYIHYQDNK